jgi:hypothetical protein
MAGAQWYFRELYKTLLTDVFFQNKNSGCTEQLILKLY